MDLPIAKLITLKFQQYDVTIYDVRADFRILFGMCNGIVLIYPKFHRDVTINDGIEFFMFSVLCVFGQTTEVSL